MTGEGQGNVVVEEDYESSEEYDRSAKRGSVVVVDEEDDEDENENQILAAGDGDARSGSSFLNGSQICDLLPRESSHRGRRHRHHKQQNHSDDGEDERGEAVDDGGGDGDEEEALDLSLVTTSVPLKKRKLESFRESNATVISNHNAARNCYSGVQKKSGAEPFSSNAATSRGFSYPALLDEDGKQEMEKSSPIPLTLTKKSSPGGANTVDGHGALVPTFSAKGLGCGRPGFITCSICNATKYYSHVQRRFGQFSCEPCSKFMKRFLRDPKSYTCLQTGRCQIGRPPGEQEPRGVSVSRCKACWLKICLEKFTLDPETRNTIEKFYAPKFNADKSVGNGGGLGGDAGSGGCPPEKELASQNYPPPLPLPVRKRKLKPVSAWSQFPLEALPKKAVTYKPAESRGRGTAVNGVASSTDLNRNSYDVKPLFVNKKPLTSRRDSSGENQSKDLYPDEDELDKIEECGKCTYCLQNKDPANANVVVVKDSCKYMRCILSGLLTGHDRDDKSSIPPLIPPTTVSSFNKLEKPVSMPLVNINELGSGHQTSESNSTIVSKGSAVSARVTATTTTTTTTKALVAAAGAVAAATTRVSPLKSLGPPATSTTTTSVARRLASSKTKSFVTKPRSGSNLALTKRNFGESGIGAETKFLDEILNTNSPFL